MAKVELNALVKAIRGRIDKAVFRRTHTGEVILSKSPDMSEVVWSEAQQAHRARFRRAVIYARQVKEIPGLQAFYLQMSLERKGSKRPFDMAVSEYMHGIDRIRGMGLVESKSTS
jgi:hypothetical protein